MLRDDPGRYKAEKKMKVKWNGGTEFLVLTHGKIYDVIAVEKGWYRILDDSGEAYLYPPEQFTVLEDAAQRDASCP